jgi:hypothetical protein
MAEIVTNTTAAQVRHALMGFRSQSLTKTVPQNATQTIFTISGGRILITALYGLVTTVIAGTTPAAKYIATPTTGTANDMCAALTITSDEAGMQWNLPAAVASALVGAASTGKSGSVSGVGTGASGSGGGWCGQIVAPGTIGFNVSAADATGAVTHSLYYIPLDDAARVVAS